MTTETGHSFEVMPTLKLDFMQLRDQKQALVEAIESTASGSSDVGLGKEQAEKLRGILHVIDFIQDEAAKVHGEKLVFGDLAAEGELE